MSTPVMHIIFLDIYQLQIDITQLHHLKIICNQSLLRFRAPSFNKVYGSRHFVSNLVRFVWTEGVVEFFAVLSSVDLQ